MKKNDWILLLSVSLYSFLFYQQGFGINFLIFTVALISLLLARDKQLLKKRFWLVAMAGSLLSAICVAIYGNTLSFVANIISLSLLSAYSFQASSLLFALLFSFYSYASSLLFMFLDRFEKKQTDQEKTQTASVKKITLIIIPLLIALVFFFMYRGSNALFNDFAKKINFDFISMNWLAFTLAGFVLLYGFFRHRVISTFSSFDERTGNSIDRQKDSSISLFGKKLSLPDENFSGIALFIMLNALLLIVNGLDFNFLFIDGKLPAGLSYSEFVHQGIGMLITSIVVAILIILFYFRGALNFYEKSSMLKFLAFLWIVQNVCMLFSTAMRNDMYISEYGLTYKRIGVYVYLFLTAIGLCTTLLKISKVKSNMYLFRINSWLFYGALVISCFFSWDEIITNFNINKSRQLERRYLVRLSYSNLPQLYELRTDSIHKHKEFQMSSEEYDLVERSNGNYDYDFESELNYKLFSFLHEKERTDWRSWNYKGAAVTRWLEEKHICKTITELDLKNDVFESLEGLQHFTELKKLNLYNNCLASVQGIQALTQLESLDLSRNPIADYAPLYELKNLKELHLGTHTEDQLNELKKRLPNTQITF